MPNCSASWPANWLAPVRASATRGRGPSRRGRAARASLPAAGPGAVPLGPVGGSVFSGVGSVTAAADPLGSPDAPPAEPLGSSEAAVVALGEFACVALGDGDAAPVHADAKIAPAPTKART